MIRHSANHAEKTAPAVAEMLNALADESVEYLVVGASAVAGHGIGLDSTKDCRQCKVL
jgi:hypothetical protein